MEHQDAALAFAINIHQRLSRDFPVTPYSNWCNWVHAQSLSPQDKWQRLLKWDLNPLDYVDRKLFRYDWQLYKLLSKLCPGGVPSEHDKAVAYAKFLSAEDRCELVNEFYASSSVTAGANAIMLSVSNIINSVLGPVGNFFNWVESQAPVRSKRCLDRFSTPRGERGLETWDSLLADFGPGVSVSRDDDKLSSISEKLLLGSVTSSCRYLAAWLSTVFEGLPQSASRDIVRGSRLTFVVKRVGEARTICYEPSMNMLVQKLIGRYLKHRLKTKLGIDLSNQERNRSLARLGSLCDSYATVDLSSASDLIAAIPVLQCVSPGWFRLLDDCRSKEYFDPMKKSWCAFHKFSTMGNGFTFELETLFFAAIVKSAIDATRPLNRAIAWREVAVYGDDLVFPKEYTNCVEQALLIAGHIPNQSKSFYVGPFRESCGGDYFGGYNVTPFKIKDLDLNDPTSVVNVFNGLFISARESPDLRSICCRFDRALVFIKRWLQSHYPRLGEGEIEKTFSKTLVEFDFQPSNRWLWSFTPNINVAYSIYEQRLVPRWLLLKTDRLVQRHGVPVEYEITTEYLRYVTLNGGQHVGLWEQSCRFRRNLCLYKPKISRTANRRASKGNVGGGQGVNPLPNLPESSCSSLVPAVYLFKDNTVKFQMGKITFPTLVTLK